jgi:hypothetical protein
MVNKDRYDTGRGRGPAVLASVLRSRRPWSLLAGVVVDEGGVHQLYVCMYVCMYGCMYIPTVHTCTYGTIEGRRPYALPIRLYSTVLCTV